VQLRKLCLPPRTRKSPDGDWLARRHRGAAGHSGRGGGCEVDYLPVLAMLKAADRDSEAHSALKVLSGFEADLTHQ
jgi:hypothetical protein